MGYGPMMRFVCAVLLSLVVCGGSAFAPPGLNTGSDSGEGADSGESAGANTKKTLTTLKDWRDLVSPRGDEEYSRGAMHINYAIWATLDDGTRQRIKNRPFDTKTFDISFDNANGNIVFSNLAGRLTEIQGTFMGMTLDAFFEVAKPVVEKVCIEAASELNVTPDDIRVDSTCEIVLFSRDRSLKPFNFVSHRLDCLSLFCDEPFSYQGGSGHLPSLQKLSLRIDLTGFFLLTPEWRKKFGAPASCALKASFVREPCALKVSKLPYYPASCFSEADFKDSGSPFFVYAGHNYGSGNKDEGSIGFYAPDQTCPWGELLPTGPLQVRMTYPRGFQKGKKASEAGGTDLSLCSEEVPNELRMMIFHQMNPLDKINMIKAAPHLCSLMALTMKHDFTLVKKPTEHSQGKNFYSLWTFKTANPNILKPEEFTVKAVPSGNAWHGQDNQTLQIILWRFIVMIPPIYRKKVPADHGCAAPLVKMVAKSTAMVRQSKNQKIAQDMISRN